MELKMITVRGVAVDFITADKTFTFTPEDEPSTLIPILNFLSDSEQTEYKSQNYELAAPTMLQKENGHIYIATEHESADLGTEAEVVRALADAFFANPNAWIVRNYQTYKRHGEKGEVKIAEILALPETQAALQRATMMLKQLIHSDEPSKVKAC